MAIVYSWATWILSDCFNQEFFYHALEETELMQDYLICDLRGNRLNCGFFIWGLILLFLIWWKVVHFPAWSGKSYPMLFLIKWNDCMILFFPLWICCVTVMVKVMVDTIEQPWIPGVNPILPRCVFSVYVSELSCYHQRMPDFSGLSERWFCFAHSFGG